MSLFGLGTEKNATEAKRYFNDAATANYPIAYKYLAYISAQSGEFRTAVVLACRGVLLTWRLRLEDRGHPNLWR
jgi:TPR repeat protein